MQPSVCVSAFFCTIFAMAVFVANRGTQFARRVDTTCSDADDDGGSVTDARLFWFVQVSDIHISRYYPDREARFGAFLHSLHRVQPRLVLESGDIADSKTDVSLDRRAQSEAEWRAYHSALRGFHPIASGRLPWLDIRGNHDAFNVPFIGGDKDLYSKYRWHRSTPSPVAGGDGNGSSTAVPPEIDFSLTLPFGRYRFVSVDAVVKPASMRHFLGELQQSDVERVRRTLQARGRPKPRLTFAFGHYPTNSISHAGTGGSRLSDVLSNHSVVAYFSGLCVRACVCVRVCASVRACVRACVRVRVCVRVRACV